MMDDRTSKGYDDKKEFTCVGCGTKVMLTKFASAKTAKCQDCKAGGVQPKADIVGQVASVRQSAPKISGDKKPSVCTSCGAETMIGKFASHKTALCDECKGSAPSSDTGGEHIFKIDKSKIDRSKLPDLDEMYVLPTVIGNEKLRNVECPACHSGTDIIKILDSSPMRGLIITYQCKNDKCRMMIQLSEQSRFKMMGAKSSDVFNYRGELIDNFLSPIQDTRTKNMIEYLVKILDDNNIPIDGSIVPSELRFVDTKTVKSGMAKESVVDGVGNPTGIHNKDENVGGTV